MRERERERDNYITTKMNKTRACKINKSKVSKPISRLINCREGVVALKHKSAITKPVRGPKVRFPIS